MFTHIVFFKLKDKSQENLQATRQKLLSMAGKIPSLRGIEVGIDVVRSSRSYDVALITRFDDLDGMKAYQTDPYHQNEVLPYMHQAAEAAAAVDYEG